MLQESVEHKKATKLQSITLGVHDGRCSPDVGHTDKKKNRSAITALPCSRQVRRALSWTPDTSRGLPVDRRSVSREHLLVGLPYFVFLLPRVPLLFQGVHLAFEVLSLQIHLTESRWTRESVSERRCCTTSGIDIPFNSLLQVLLGVIELLLQELDLALQSLVRRLRRLVFVTDVLCIG